MKNLEENCWLGNNNSYACKERTLHSYRLCSTNCSGVATPGNLERETVRSVDCVQCKCRRDWLTQNQLMLCVDGTNSLKCFVKVIFRIFGKKYQAPLFVILRGRSGSVKSAAEMEKPGLIYKSAEPI